jgi:hypothetical protein
MKFILVLGVRPMIGHVRLGSENVMPLGKGMTNAHAVDAALEAMPYGLCVWGEDLTLQVFNSLPTPSKRE